MIDPKGKMINFKASAEYLGMLDKLGSELSLDRSKTIRVALDEAIEKHIAPGYKGELIVVPFGHYQDIFKSFEIRLKRYEKDARTLKRLRLSPKILPEVEFIEYVLELERIANREGKEAADEFKKQHPKLERRRLGTKVKQ